MTGDRTDHVIESIDHCLDDWEVSGDAMRWKPERPQRTEPIPLRWRYIEEAAATPLRLDPGPIPLAECIRAFADSVERAAAAMGLALTAWQRDVLPGLFDPTLFDPTPDDEDPRQRALRLRRERGTGPRYDVVHQPRPRRHGGTHAWPATCSPSKPPAGRSPTSTRRSTRSAR